MIDPMCAVETCVWLMTPLQTDPHNKAHDAPMKHHSASRPTIAPRSSDEGLQLAKVGCPETSDRVPARPRTEALCEIIPNEYSAHLEGLF